jgi:hypothetical protein
MMMELVILTLAFCVAGGLLLGYYFFTVNYLLTKYWSTKWSTFQFFCEGRFHPTSGVPLAIVRGAALASISLGVCAILRYAAVRFRLVPWVPVLDLSFYQGFAFPSLILVLTVALSSLVVALILSFSTVLLRRVVRNPVLLAGCGALIWLSTFSYLFPWDPTPFFWFEWVIVFAFALVVCFALVYYDFFTLWFFLFSFYFVIDNYVMWRVFQNLTNFEYSLVFLVWSGVVATCVYSILSRRLAAVWRQVSISLE